MKRSIGSGCLAFVFLAILLSGCTAAQTLVPSTLTFTPVPPTDTPIPTATPIPPTATLKPPAVSGTLIGSDGAIAGAEVTLKTYRDEACVKLAEATELSESETEQLDECSSEFASTTSDTQGQYRFPDVSPGWYKLSFSWTLAQKPDVMFPIDFRDGFLIAFYETNTSPKVYSALALGEIFQFSGKEDMIIDFNYGSQ
jgi:hypothetical protein